MQKLIIYLFLLIQTCQSMSQEVVSIRLSEMTRGFERTIVVSEKEILINENGIESKSKNSTENWNTIKDLLKKINLSQIPDFKSPTNKRASDAALHATFEVVSKDKTYISTTFDDTNPPKELRGLVIELKKNSRKD